MSKEAAHEEILLSVYGHGRRGRIGMQLDHLLKFLAVEFFFSLFSNQEFFVLGNFGFESFLGANRFFKHAEEVN